MQQSSASKQNNSKNLSETSRGYSSGKKLAVQAQGPEFESLANT